MATPNLSGGVLERNKPLTYRPHVAWRFEATLAGGGSITTPIFDIVPDGRPFTEVEIGAFNVVRVPSSVFRIVVGLGTASTNNPGARFQVFHLQDNGGQLSPFTWYVQARSGQGLNFYRYQCPGRRCQFRFVNTPLGPVAALNQTFQVEIEVEG